MRNGELALPIFFMADSEYSHLEFTVNLLQDKMQQMENTISSYKKVMEFVRALSEHPDLREEWECWLAKAEIITGKGL